MKKETCRINCQCDTDMVDLTGLWVFRKFRAIRAGQEMSRATYSQSHAGMRRVYIHMEMILFTRIDLSKRWPVLVYL